MVNRFIPCLLAMLYLTGCLPNSGTHAFLSGGGGTASVVYDRQCKRLVDPHDTFALSMALTQLALSMALECEKGTPCAERQELAIRNAAKQVNWMNPSLEVALFSERHEQLNGVKVRQMNLEDYELAEGMVDAMLAILPEAPPYDIGVYIKSGNAMEVHAEAGGFIYVSAAALIDEELLYFLLAHEMAHLLQRHQTRQNQALLVDSVESGQEIRDFMSSSNLEKNKRFKEAFNMAKDTNAILRDYNVAQELQADACATHLLKLADPDNFAEHMEAFRNYLITSRTEEGYSTKNGLSKVSPFEVHPTSVARQANLEKLLSIYRVDAAPNQQ